MYPRVVFQRLVLRVEEIDADTGAAVGGAGKRPILPWLLAGLTRALDLSLFWRMKKSGSGHRCRNRKKQSCARYTSKEDAF